MNDVSTNWVYADVTPLKIKFKKTHDDAKLPSVNNEACLTGDSGYDLFSVEAVSYTHLTLPTIYSV